MFTGSNFKENIVYVVIYSLKRNKVRNSKKKFSRLIQNQDNMALRGILQHRNDDMSKLSETTSNEIWFARRVVLTWQLRDKQFLYVYVA